MTDTHLHWHFTCDSNRAFKRAGRFNTLVRSAFPSFVHYVIHRAADCRLRDTSASSSKHINCSSYLVHVAFQEPLLTRRYLNTSRQVLNTSLPFTARTSSHFVRVASTVPYSHGFVVRVELRSSVVEIRRVQYIHV